MKKSNVIMKMARCGLLALTCLAAFSMFADSPANQDRLANANTSFAFDLLKQIVKKQTGANIFISPYSVSTALQMVGDGATGGTKQEIDGVLHVNGMTAVNAVCQRLDRFILTGQSEVTLNLANAIWFKQGVELNPEFAESCSNFFQAKVAALDFSGRQSAKIINDWAQENTQGRIKDVVQWPMPSLTRMIVINAIYFKGHWDRAFEKGATKDRPFTLPDETQIQVSMMQQRGHFDYYQAPGFQAVRLPYAGGRLEMDLFLPGRGSSIKKLLSGFEGGGWESKILSQFRDREGVVALPRFKLNYNVVLNDPLEALGMKRAFGKRADFSRMCAEKVFLSEVKQKSFVEVDEEGTEAAAVTMATFRAMVVMRPQNPFQMNLDHPFLFVIGDQAAHSILFMGVVSNPGAEASGF